MEQGNPLENNNEIEMTETVLRDALSGLWDSIKATAAEMRSIKEENASLKNATARLSKIDEELALLRQANEELIIEREEILTSTTTAEELTKELDSEWERAEKYERENKELLLKLKELEENEKNFSFARQEIVRKNHELNDRAEEIIKLKDKVSELDSKLYEYENLHRQIDEILDKNKALEFKLSELKEIKEKPEIEGAQTGLDDKTKFEEEISKYRHAWEAQEQALRKYSLQLQQLQSQKTDIERKHSEALEKNLHLAEELKELSKENQAIIEQLDQMQKLRDQISQKDSLIDEFTAKLKVLGEEKIAAEAEVNHYKNKFIALSDNLNEIGLVKEELEQSHNENERLIKANEYQKEQIARLELDLKQFSNELLIKKRQIQDLSDSLVSLKKESVHSKNLQLESESVQSKMNELESRLIMTADERNLLTTQAEELIKSINDYKIKVKELDSIIESHDEEVKNKELLTGESEKKINLLEHELKTKNDAISSLTEQINEIEIERKNFFFGKEELLKRVEKYVSKLDHILNN